MLKSPARRRARLSVGRISGYSGLIEELDVDTKDAMLMPWVRKLNRIREMQAGAKDDGDATRVPGARCVKDLHTGPYYAPPCFRGDHALRVRGQTRLRQNRSMCSLFPQPP